MANRKAAPSSLYTKGYSFQMYYLEDLRNPSYVRRPQRYPFLRDRDAANIDFLKERRTYYGKIPTDPPRDGGIYSSYSIRQPFDWASGPNRYINNAKLYKLPDNMVATTSGLEELAEGQIHPDFLIPAIGNFEYIADSENTVNIGSQQHFIANYPTRQQRFDGRPDGEYYPVHGTTERIPRIFYFNHTDPPYNAPTYPSTRYPTTSVPTKFGK